MQLLAPRILGPVRSQREAPGSQAVAWAVCSVVGDAKILTSMNIGSLTDNGTGDVTLTYASALSIASDYAWFGSATTTDMTQVWTRQATPPTATSIRVQTTNAAGALTNFEPLMMTCVGRV